MIDVLIEAKVSNSQEFKGLIDFQAEQRHQAGEHQYSVEFDMNDDQTVLLFSSWRAISDAQEYWLSTDAGEHIKAWNTVSEPTIKYLRTSD